MTDNRTIKAKAREQLGGQIFANNWLLMLVALLIYSALISVSTFTVLGAILLTGPLTYGLSRLTMNRVHGNEKIELGDLFSAFGECFSDALILNIIEGIFIALWSLLFIIPGIVKRYSYSMAFYIQQQSDNKNWKYCLDESKRIMNGHKFQLFMLELSFLGWLILGALCFGIGILFVEPYMVMAEANFFEELYNKDKIAE